MFILKLIIRNAFRHKLRAILTIIGVAIAVLAFGLLRTLVGLWYLGAENASATRLVTRNAISLVFSLPISYKDRIRQVPGVKSVSWGNWFGGIYIDEKHFFANYAVEPKSYLDLYPEFVLSPDQKKDFLLDRKGCIVGRKLADLYGWKIGDLITLKGTIFPGQWEFVLRGIYKGAEKSTEERVLLFQWDYLNESMKKTIARRADQAGFYMIGVAKPELAAEVATSVDAIFRNSLAETLTETEKAFHMSFISMTEAIMVAIQIVSYMVIVIIMVVAANTMAMTARERMSEYAVLKTLGFGNRFLFLLISGESITLALAGGLLGMLLAFPAANVFAKEMSTLLPVFHIQWETLLLATTICLAIGLLAAAFPTWRAVRIRIAPALSHVG